jgi:hypothetical protein
MGSVQSGRLQSSISFGFRPSEVSAVSAFGFAAVQSGRHDGRDLNRLSVEFVSDYCCLVANTIRVFSGR